MIVRFYRILSKFPFNFGLFKRAKYLCNYVDGRIDCGELIAVCKDGDLERLVDYFIKRGDGRFREVLANRPRLLRLPKYTGFWKEVIADYPEKILDVLSAVHFVEEARVIEEALKGGLVALDLEVNSSKGIFEAGAVVFSNHRETSFLYFDKSRESEFVKLIRVLFESDAILVGHNILNHDLKFIKEKYGIEVRNRVIDTLYLNCLVEPGSRPRGLSMLVRHTEHDPVEDARASLVLLEKLIEKIREYGLVREARELLADNPYVSGLPNIIGEAGDSPRVVEEGTEDKNGEKKLFVVVSWKGLARPWSPYVLDPASYAPRDPWERAAVFSALCAQRDPKCCYGDPNEFRKTWVNDERTRKAILEVSKTVRRREEPRTSVETLPEYVPYLTGKFDEVELNDGELVLSSTDLYYFFRLSDKVVAIVSLAKAFSEVSEKIGLDKVELVDPGFNSPLLLPESSSSDPLNVASNIAGLLKHINLPAVVLVSNSYEKALARRVFGYFCSAYVDDRDPSAYRLAVENNGIAITDSFERIPSGFKTIVVFSDRGILREIRKEDLCGKLCYGLMKVYGIARRIGAEKVAFLSFVGSALADLAKVPEFGRVLSHADVKRYERGKPEGSVFVNVWRSVEEAVSFAERVAEEVWGFRYRPYQRKAAAMLLSAYSLSRSISPFGVVILPTGSGKSVIFQSAALALHKATGALTVVVSPLQALIQDQVEGLMRRGVRTARLDWTVPPSQRLDTVLDAILGNIEILYVTPERFERDELRMILEYGNVGYVILDEVHCLSTWGNTFRPSYRYMARLLSLEREKRFLPIYGFSATLPKDVLEDILDVLNISKKDVDEVRIDFSSDFEPQDAFRFLRNLILRGPATRPEIKIHVVQARNDSDKLNKVADIVKKLRDALDASGKPWIGLVFASFVKSSLEHENVDYIARFLSERLGEEVLYFHGQMSPVEKDEVIEKLKRAVESVSKPRIVVATKAFGMGIDLPNVRFVVHAHVPASIEEYYQEIGRGGRDRRKCYAIAVYSPDDFDEKKWLIKSVTPKNVEDAINIIRSFAAGKEVAIPLNPFYDHFGLSDGKAILKKTLQVLEENGLIECEITNGRLVAYKVLGDADFSGFEDAIIHRDGDVVVVDINCPKVLRSVIAEEFQKLEREKKVRRINYSWDVGSAEVWVGRNGTTYEIGYILLKDVDLRPEKVSLSSELELYQHQLQKLRQLEEFFKRISSLPWERMNREAHRNLKMYLEEGFAEQLERRRKEVLEELEKETVKVLGKKSIILGLMGSGKTERLAKIAAYYIMRYSEKGVLVVSPAPYKSDIVDRIRRYVGYDASVYVKSAKNLRYEDILNYEVLVFDDVDVALAKSLISIKLLSGLANFNRKIYVAADPVILKAFGYFEELLRIFSSYNFAALKSVELPFKAKMDGFEVRVVPREACEAKMYRSTGRAVSYLPGKFDGALAPAVEPESDNYFELLYLCLKASKNVPKGLRVDERAFGEVLTKWLRELPENVVELS